MSSGYAQDRERKGSQPLPALRSVEERNRLCVENDGLVRQQVFRIIGSLRFLRDFTEADLLQIGRLGLLRAGELWDEDQGVKVCTYACWCIHRTVWRALLAQGGLIRLPDYVSGAERLSLNRALSPRQLPVSQDGDDKGGPADQRDALAELHAEEQRAALADALKRLPRRTREVIRRRFFGGEILAEIAADLGVTRERVRQIERAGLRRLRKILSADLLTD